MGLPGWNSIQATGVLSNFFFYASIGALILLGLAEVFSHRYGERHDLLVAQQQRAEKDANDGEIARLHRDTASLTADAEKSKASIADANAKAQEAQRETEKMRNDNLKLQKELSPRRISPEQHDKLVAALSKLHGTIHLQSMTDSESGLYAADILKTFKDAGWTAATPEFPLGEIWHGLIFEDTTDANTVAVLKAFLAAGIPDCKVARRGKPSVTILVGGKPPPF